MISKKVGKSWTKGTFLKRFTAIVIIAEVSCCLLSYYGFHKLNSSSDTRHHVHKNWPSVLEGYYYISDDLAGLNIREQDLSAWSRSKANWEE